MVVHFSSSITLTSCVAKARYSRRGGRRWQSYERRPAFSHAQKRFSKTDRNMSTNNWCVDTTPHFLSTLIIHSTLLTSAWFFNSFLSHTLRNLYYYRRRVCVFAKLDQFLPVRSHFDTKRPVNFFHIATFPSPTFGSLFAFHCPLFFTKNNNLQCRDVLKSNGDYQR